MKEGFFFLSIGEMFLVISKHPTPADLLELPLSKLGFFEMDSTAMSGFPGEPLMDRKASWRVSSYQFPICGNKGFDAWRVTPGERGDQSISRLPGDPASDALLLQVRDKNSPQSGHCRQPPSGLEMTGIFISSVTL